MALREEKQVRSQLKYYHEYDVEAQLERDRKIVEDYIKGGENYYRKTTPREVMFEKPGVFLTGKGAAWFFVKVIIAASIGAYFIKGMFSLGGNH